MTRKRAPITLPGGKVYDVGRGQLGIPTPERQSKSRQGFDVSQLAAGHDLDGGVVQARERAMLTPPALLQQRLEEMLQAARRGDSELPGRVKFTRTSSDRTIEPYSHIVWEYVKTHVDALKGNIGISDYEGRVRSSEIHKLPMSQNGFDRRRFYAYAREHMPLAVTEFLDWVVVHDNQELSEMKALSRFEMGKLLTRVENDRDAKNAADGALAMCCRILAEAHRDYDMLEQRRKRLNKLAVDDQKKIAYR